MNPAPAGYELVAHICILPTKDAGPTKFFTSPSDPRGFPVYRAALAAIPLPPSLPAAQQAEPLTQDERIELDRLRSLVNSPEVHDFARGVVLEAAHQRERWCADHDAGKAPADWFWLLGYLGGKALVAHAQGNTEKALHHTISTAAACANWHAAISGTSNAMRPGIDPVARGLIDADADRKSRHAAAAPWLE